jgi:hypothetical protein
LPGVLEHNIQLYNYTMHYVMQHIICNIDSVCVNTKRLQSRFQYRTTVRIANIKYNERIYMNEYRCIKDIIHQIFNINRVKSSQNIAS